MWKPWFGEIHFNYLKSHWEMLKNQNGKIIHFLCYSCFLPKAFQKRFFCMTINILVMNHYLHLTENVIEMPVYCSWSTLAAVFDTQKQIKKIKDKKSLWSSAITNAKHTAIAESSFTIYQVELHSTLSFFVMCTDKMWYWKNWERDTHWERAESCSIAIASPCSTLTNLFLRKTSFTWTSIS